MQIGRLRIENFRSVRDLDVTLDETTVFIGANNTGKTAILEAVRIALSRRWGRRGTGFTEYDTHRSGEAIDPKSALPVKVFLHFEESPAARWDPDLVAALDHLVILNEAGDNLISLRVTCEWSNESEAFEPAWEFLDAAGQPLSGRAQRATNLSDFFTYVPLFYLGALRDAADEFGPRSPIWGRLLKSIRIPSALEGEVQTTLDDLDAQLLVADPKLSGIAATIGQAARVAVGQTEGDARLRMLPMSIWDLISRANVVLKNENPSPWLPLNFHGQGLQSLSVIFLFQAAAFQRLEEEEQPGAEPIFLIEEPEAHLHPQAARILWEQVNKLPGQKLVTTHSPYFVQHVPLRNLRMVKQREIQTEVTFMPRRITSDLTWNEKVATLAAHQGKMFIEEAATGKISATHWFDEKIAGDLKGCFRGDADQARIESAIKSLRYHCRGLVTPQEEHELSFLGRRIRGEIFFARQWVLVEGQSEYVLLHAIGRALGYPLDRHGIAVIDFQNNGAADIYPALATSFAIPWWMITDGDAAPTFRDQLLNRGFADEELDGQFMSLPHPNTLEEQLFYDGHEALLRGILADATTKSALDCPFPEFMQRLKNKI